MIVDKHEPKISGEVVPEADIKKDVIPDKPVLEPYRSNGMIGAYLAVRKILENIKKDPEDPDSPPLFKTVKMDNGQVGRLKNNLYNKEYAVALPAVFIHYIDVYYNQGMSGVSEGKAIMRLHYILNRLNNSDDGVETEGMTVFQRIVEAIESQKGSFPELVSRFQLKYWDQPLTFDDAVQPYWIDYQIWFSDYTGYKFKDYKEVYVVCPPFTQHSDQNETANPDNLPDVQIVDPDSSAGVKIPE